MAYDEELANRVREELRDEKFVETKMFGGLGFLIGGHMAIAVSGQGGILVRVHGDEYEAALAEPGADEFVMRGRAMRGWVRADPVDDDLRRWVARGVAVARSLPAKGA